MSDRVRILLHEAIDIDRAVREYADRKPISRGDLVAIVEDNEDVDQTVDELLSYIGDEDDDVQVNVSRVEDLINRLAEIYETALARGSVAAR